MKHKTARPRTVMDLHLRICDEGMARYVRDQAAVNQRSWQGQAIFMLKCAMEGKQQPRRTNGHGAQEPV